MYNLEEFLTTYYKALHNKEVPQPPEYRAWRLSILSPNMASG